MTVQYEQHRANYGIYRELPENEIKTDLINDGDSIKNKRILRKKTHDRVGPDHLPLRQSFNYENRYENRMEEIPRIPVVGRNFLNEYRARNHG